MTGSDRWSPISVPAFSCFVIGHLTLAKEYLRSLGQRRHSEDVVRSILKFRGSLAQAAPAELAELTATALIPKRRPDERRNRREL